MWVQRDVTWLAQTEEWPGLASLVLVEAERTRRGVTSCERRAYISSLAVSAEEMGAKVRGHWHVENRLHWVLDVSFGEDRARIGRKNGAENMSLMRKIAMNLLQRAPSLVLRGFEGRWATVLGGFAASARRREMKKKERRTRSPPTFGDHLGPRA